MIDKGLLTVFHRVLCGSNSISTAMFPRLYQVKGKTTLVCTQKKTISWQHFNSSSIMILQTKKILFVWIGRACNAVEKQRGIKLASRIKDMYAITELAIVDDGYEQSLSDRR